MLVAYANAAPTNRLPMDQKMVQNPAIVPPKDVMAKASTVKHIKQKVERDHT